MKLNLKKPIKDLRGKAIEGSLLSESLANVLVSGNSGQPAKAFSIASRLIDKGEVELDKPDTDFVRAVVNGSNSVNDLGKYRLIEALEEAEKTPSKSAS